MHQHHAFVTAQPLSITHSPSSPTVFLKWRNLNLSRFSPRLLSGFPSPRPQWICELPLKNGDGILNATVSNDLVTESDRAVDRTPLIRSWKKEARLLFAEFIATWIFVYVSASASGSVTGLLSKAAVSAAIFCSLIPISGAFMNPAITLALWATRRIPSLRAALYIPIQLVASITALIATRGMGIATPLATSIPAAATQFDLTRAFMNEAIPMFTLVLVVFQCALATDKEGGMGTKIAAVYIGLALAALASTFPGIFNPARAFGFALLLSSFSHHWVFWAGPIVGAVAAALISEHIFLAPAGKRQPSSILITAGQNLSILSARVKELGLAGLIAYGVTNVLYYGIAFTTIILRAGVMKDPAAFAKAWALTWAGSQVTKPLRLAIAVFSAPFVNRLLPRKSS